jgi:hypothetical protein
LYELRKQIKHSLRQHGQIDESRDVNGAPELKEIKADPMPLGYYQGKDNKKFMSKNFKNLLLEIHDRTMHDQKDILDKTLSDWMGENSQMDDILVIGARV